jgi:pre-mRNA-processing factor 19
MICSISQQVADLPVASRVSGHVYERTIIARHLALHGSCPFTGQPMQEADLVPLQLDAPLPTASIPEAIDALAHKFDQQVLHLHSLKAELLKARCQLSDALYRLEAATRVIAKLQQ